MSRVVSITDLHGRRLLPAVPRGDSPLGLHVAVGHSPLSLPAAHRPLQLDWHQRCAVGHQEMEGLALSLHHPLRQTIVYVGFIG